MRDATNIQVKAAAAQNKNTAVAGMGLYQE